MHGHQQSYDDSRFPFLVTGIAIDFRISSILLRLCHYVTSSLTSRRLVASPLPPPPCYLVEDLKTWGVSTFQGYSGMPLPDLRRLKTGPLIPAGRVAPAIEHFGPRRRPCSWLQWHISEDSLLWLPDDISIIGHVDDFHRFSLQRICDYCRRLLRAH